VLLQLLDVMDDHYDGKVSDDEFMQAAASAWDSVALSAAHDPDLAIAVRVLEEFLAGARTGMLLRPLYGDLRIALVDLEEFRSALYSDLAVTSREGRCTCPPDANRRYARRGAARYRMDSSSVPRFQAGGPVPARQRCRVRAAGQRPEEISDAQSRMPPVKYSCS
jgi:hypothetical protein